MQRVGMKKKRVGGRERERGLYEFEKFGLFRISQ